MSPQLSIYWQGPENVNWQWQGEPEQYAGSWDELVDQKRNRNLNDVPARVYLPHDWFTSLSVTVPANARRVPEQVLRFAAEEQLAQDIDSLHIVPLGKAERGHLPVLVIERERIDQLRLTLAEYDVQLIQVFDSGWFEVPKPVTADICIDIDEHRILCRSGWLLHQVHPNGFSQWFELWKQTQNLEEDSVTISLTSRASNDQARQLKTELEAGGDRVDWSVTPATTLSDWDEQCRETKAAGNLMVGPFATRKSRSYTALWIPTAIAATLTLTIWTGLTIVEAKRDQQLANETWNASEAVFKQVFGSDKRVQRPLMVRELENRIVSLNQGGAEAEGSVLSSLEAINKIDRALVLEDFRYQQSRNEMLFTLKQADEVEGDAFARLESVKSTLQQQGYKVEYSASQDRGAVRGKYQVSGGA